MSDPTPPLGHNNPPVEIELSDIATLLDPAVMRDQFELDHQDLLKRRDELLAGVDRFFEQAKQIKTEEHAARATDFVGQLKLLWKDVETERMRVARPFLSAQAVVQKFFKAETLDLVDRAAREIESRLTFYSREKAAEAKRKLDAEKRAAQKAADEAAKAALASMRPSQLEDAAKLADVAEKAAVRAETTTQAALGQVRGDHGSVASYVSHWGYEVVDLALVPREWLTLDVAKVTAAIRGGLRDGDTPAIAGLRIVDNPTVRVRA